MRITLNGEPSELADSATIADVLRGLGLPPETVAVEVNQGIVRRERFVGHRLAEGDRVEILSFVGGG